MHSTGYLLSGQTVYAILVVNACVVHDNPPGCSVCDVGYCLPVTWFPEDCCQRDVETQSDRHLQDTVPFCVVSTYNFGTFYYCRLSSR